MRELIAAGPNHRLLDIEWPKEPFDGRVVRYYVVDGEKEMARVTGEWCYHCHSTTSKCITYMCGTCRLMACDECEGCEGLGLEASNSPVPSEHQDTVQDTVSSSSNSSNNEAWCKRCEEEVTVFGDCACRVLGETPACRRSAQKVVEGHLFFAEVRARLMEIDCSPY